MNYGALQQPKEPNGQPWPWRPWENGGGIPDPRMGPRAPMGHVHPMDTQQSQRHFLPGQLAQAVPGKEAPNGYRESRVTIWNATEQRKLSGNAAPFRRNLDAYLALHPDWELYTGQDEKLKKKRRQPPSGPAGGVPAEKHQRKYKAEPELESDNAADDSAMASLLWAVGRTDRED